MTCRFAHDDAAYVLGALAPQERQSYEEHLAECPDCTRAVREVAGLPGLLSKAPHEVFTAAAPEGLVEPDDQPPVPDTLLPGMARRVRTERRRRWLLAGAAAAAACVLAAGVGVVVRGAGESPVSPPAAVSLTPVGSVPLTATARIADLPWGTAVSLQCTYLGRYGAPGAEYTLVAVNRDGAVDELARWAATPGSVSQVTGATTWPRSELAGLEIRTPAGTPVMRLAT